MKKAKITITSLPKWSYFQWFLLGFYELKHKGIIDIKFDIPLIDKLSLYIDNYYMFGIGQRYYSGKDSFCMEGYIDCNGIQKTFCIDNQDSPFLFDANLLNKVDIYFKMQCPKEFDERGFKLNENVWIPWTDHAHIDSNISIPQRSPRKICYNLFDNINKIRPLMVGPRHLGYGNGYRALNKGLKNSSLSKTNKASKTLMCYFGNSVGPTPSKDIKDKQQIDWNWEPDIMSIFQGQIDHPNEKRAQANQILKELGDSYDARLIRDGYSGKNDVVHTELIVPLNKFCDHISHFMYNLNISGFRMSIPNRFIESFMVGTAIVTDKLAVKWYRPFDEEVVETVEMGYLSNNQVDWEQFKKDITNLPIINKQNVLNAYEKKWAPAKVASYIIQEVLNS